MVIWYTNKVPTPPQFPLVKKWFEREKELATGGEKKLNKGLDMLKKSFTELWD